MPYFHFKLTLFSLFVRKYGLGLNPLTPKIWLSILLSSYHTCPRKLIMRIRCSIKVINCTWWVWVFSLPVYCIMYGYFREKLHVNHFWELKVNRIVLKWTCIQNVFFSLEQELNHSKQFSHYQLEFANVSHFGQPSERLSGMQIQDTILIKIPKLTCATCTKRESRVLDSSS